LPTICNPKRAQPQWPEIRNCPRGLIHLNTANRDTAQVLADIFQNAGYAIVWNPPGQLKTVVRGAAAGVWDGGQLDDPDARALATFCRSLARDAAPVVALLDFPRRDRCELARQLGAAVVLGKPWINADLVATIERVAHPEASIPTTGGRAA
jgi:hypothetical protein